MRFNVIKRPRKRNRSSPTNTRSYKKVKQPDTNDSDQWSDTETVSSISFDTENSVTDEQSNVCPDRISLTTSAATSSSENNTINSIINSTGFTTDTCTAGPTVVSPVPVPAAAVVITQPLITNMSTLTRPNDLLVNPESGLSSSQMASTGTVIQETFSQPTWGDNGGGYPQQYQQHISNMPPNMTMQSMPMSGPMPPSCPISDMDCLRIATMVQKLMRADINQLVKYEVQQATNHLTKKVVTLQKSNDDLSTQVRDLNGKVDDLEQYGRRMCIRIFGVPEMQDENVNYLVMKVRDEIHANVTRHDINRAHRVGRKDDSGKTDGRDDDITDGQETAAKTVSRSRDIIVKFTNSTARLEFLKGRKALREMKANIFINEDLTASRMKLAFHCRDLKRDKNSSVSKTWVFGGNVFVQDTGGVKHKFLTLSDLNTFSAASGQAPPAGQGNGPRNQMPA